TGCQFSFTCSGVMRGRVNQTAWNRARAVASDAMSGSVFARVGNATHFHTTAVAPGWRSSLVQVSQVGSHLFYRFGGRSGSSGAVTYAARPSAPAEQPRLIQAGLNPVETARQAGQAVAYTMVLAQEGRSLPAPAAQPATPPRPAAATTPTPTAARAANTQPTSRPARPAEAPAKTDIVETASSPA
ncbi:MAG: cell wall hydrolase, partial [Brevundimonas sp.]